MLVSKSEYCIEANIFQPLALILGGNIDEWGAWSSLRKAQAAMVTSTSTPASMLMMICLTTSVGALRLCGATVSYPMANRIEEKEGGLTQSDACGCASHTCPTSLNPLRKASCAW